MRKISGILSLVVVFVMVVGMAHAQAADVTIIGEYNGKKITSVLKMGNGKWEDVPFEQFLDDMNTKEYKNRTPQVVEPEYVASWYTYWQNSGYYYHATPRKASPDFGCPSGTTSPCSVAIQYTLTQSKSASISLSLPQWNAIQTTLGYTYQDQVSVASTYTLPIPPGKFGHIEFAPKYYHSEGSLRGWISGAAGIILVGTQSVSTETPQKLYSGMLDGYLLGIITDYPT